MLIYKHMGISRKENISPYTPVTPSLSHNVVVIIVSSNVGCV